MRIYLKMYSSIISLIGIIITFVAMIFCFFNAGATFLFSDEASLFALIFGLDGESILLGDLFAFIFLLLGIITSFTSFLFSRLGKSSIKNASTFALISIGFNFLSSLLFFLTPCYTQFYSFSFGPFLVASLILISCIFQIPNAVYKKL